MKTIYSGYSAASGKVLQQINHRAAGWCRKTVSLFLLLILAFAPAIASAIDAPGNPRGTETQPSEIKWEWDKVSGAALYDVIVNDVFQAQIPDNHFYSRNLGAGEHTLVVKAISADWNYSPKSVEARRRISGSSAGSSSDNQGNQPSQAASSSSLKAPSDVRGTEVRPAVLKWEWEAVSSATQYEVTVNGAFAAKTSDLYLYNHDLGNGEHSMSVRAINAEGDYSPKSATVRRTINGAPQSSSSNNAQNDQPQPSPDSSGSSIARPEEVRGTEVRPAIVKWEWDQVPGADRYQVQVDGEPAGETSELFLRSNNMSIGEHFMIVRAISSNGEYSADSRTARVFVEGTAQNKPANQPPAPQASEAPQAAENDTGLIDPLTWSQPNVDKQDFKLVFSDEFNTNSLNRNRWNTQLRWDGSFNGDRYEYRTVNGENQFYVNIFSPDQNHLDLVVPNNNPFEFNGSRLAIRAKRNPLKSKGGSNGYGPLDLMARQKDFLSGVISTYDKFKQKYGYYEARIKIPNQVGTFPAFWLHHQKREWEGTQKTEIDIMENLGHAPWYVYNSFHYFTGVAEGVTGKPHFIKPKPQGQIYTGTDYSEQYHVYAVEWKPGYLKFMIDGQKVSEVWNDNVDHEELYIIINMAIGGNWTNFPSNAGGTGREEGNHFPNQNDKDTWSNPALEIDYIRVYKRK